MSVHNHAPWRPICNERDVDSQLRGACLDDDGTARHSDPEPPTCTECNGLGVLDTDLNVPGIVCADCDGAGYIWPPGLKGI